MRLLDAGQSKVLRAVAALADGNPFLPERLDDERKALGSDFVSTGAPIWRAEIHDDVYASPNVPRLQELFEELAPELRERLAAGAEASEEELRLYQQLVFYTLYQRHEDAWRKLIEQAERGRGTTGRVASYRRFREEVEFFLALPERHFPASCAPEHLFALGYQIRRAFHHTFRQIYGGSMPAAMLRATVWEAVFTHDPVRYRDTLYDRLADIPTLIVGESGTGKELVARAIAFARYIPFDDESATFHTEYNAGLYALNLSALSPTLVESELFGHRRGAFTGAVDDRRGWLETCPAEGSVFLDEIGELDTAIQVKLLRVLQERAFQRIGETSTRRFEGKILAATNRDLSEEMQAGRFRRDFYYRLCADVIRTPTLREQIEDRPDELRDLCAVLSRRLIGDSEAERLTDECTAFIASVLPANYPWPGNVRELEQCVRGVLIRGRYEPPAAHADAPGDWPGEWKRGELSADEVLRRYCTYVYAHTKNYEETARRLGIDRRTVKSRIDEALLLQLEKRD